MITPDQIKLETHFVVVVEDGDYPIGLRQFALLETKEQSDYLYQMLEIDNPEWVNFDEQVFYFVSLWDGETIESLQERESIYRNGFYIDAERNE
jgi:hypothetical protein